MAPGCRSALEPHPQGVLLGFSRPSGTPAGTVGLCPLRVPMPALLGLLLSRPTGQQNALWARCGASGNREEPKKQKGTRATTTLVPCVARASVGRRRATNKNPRYARKVFILFQPRVPERHRVDRPPDAGDRGERFALVVERQDGARRIVSVHLHHIQITG